MPPTRKVAGRTTFLEAVVLSLCIETPVHCLFSALEEAAVRFRELQAEKELRQLQEDRKNDRKPPPYKHIKVREGEKMVFVKSLRLPGKILIEIENHLRDGISNGIWTDASQCKQLQTHLLVLTVFNCTLGISRSYFPGPAS